MWPSNPTAGRISKGKNKLLKRHRHFHIHGNFLHLHNYIKWKWPKNSLTDETVWEKGCMCTMGCYLVIKRDWIMSVTTMQAQRDSSFTFLYSFSLACRSGALDSTVNLSSYPSDFSILPRTARLGKKWG